LECRRPYFGHRLGVRTVVTKVILAFPQFLRARFGTLYLSRLLLLLNFSDLHLVPPQNSAVNTASLNGPQTLSHIFARDLRMNAPNTLFLLLSSCEVLRWYYYLRTEDVTMKPICVVVKTRFVKMFLLTGLSHT
jgi:hypothetical protein